MPFKRRFKDKCAGSSRERICCPNSVRLVFSSIFSSPLFRLCLTPSSLLLLTYPYVGSHPIFQLSPILNPLSCYLPFFAAFIVLFISPSSQQRLIESHSFQSTQDAQQLNPASPTTNLYHPFPPFLIIILFPLPPLLLSCQARPTRQKSNPNFTRNSATLFAP